MKSTSIIVAALLSALTLPVFAQTGTPAATAASPTATAPAAASAKKTVAAPKAKTVKHSVKSEKKAKSSKQKTSPAPTAVKASSDTAAAATK